MNSSLLLLILGVVLISGCVTEETKQTEIEEKQVGDETDDILVTFEVKVPDWTPREDKIYLSIKEEWPIPTPILMDMKEEGVWTLDFRAQKNVELKYRYERNGRGFSTSEQFVPDADEFRVLDVGREPLTIRDEVKAWRWLREKKPEAELSQFRPASLPERGEEFVVGILLWDYTDPQFVEYAPSTLDRIKEKGFRYVQITYFPLTVVSEDPIVMETNPESNEESRIITEEAKKRGLKVIWWVGIETDPGVESSNVHSDDWYREYVGKWRAGMVDAAREAEKHGVSIFIPSNTWPDSFPTEEQRAFVSSLVRDAYKEMRKVYSGKITSDFYWEPGVDFYDELDWVGDKWWYELTDKKETNVQEMKEEAERIIDEKFEKMYEKYGKPIFLQVGYASYDGAAGALQMNTEGPELAEWFPYNDNYPADFQEQADAFEAFFQAIYDEPIFIGAGAFGYGYWNMHDKAPGIRDKPAEAVWVRWNEIIYG